MLEGMPQIFHTASIWLTLALALQRWINVCHAVTARLWCTMSITKKGVAGIMVMAFLHQTTRYTMSLCTVKSQKQASNYYKPVGLEY